MLYTLLIVFLVLALLGGLPPVTTYHGFGYWPSGGLGFLVIVLLILILAGRV